MDHWGGLSEEVTYDLISKWGEEVSPKKNKVYRMGKALAFPRNNNNKKKKKASVAGA